MELAISGFLPECACWVHRPGDALPRLAVAEADSTKIHIYDGRYAPNKCGRLFGEKLIKE